MSGGNGEGEGKDRAGEMLVRSRELAGRDMGLVERDIRLRERLLEMQEEGLDVLEDMAFGEGSKSESGRVRLRAVQTLFTVANQMGRRVGEAQAEMARRAQRLRSAERGMEDGYVEEFDLGLVEEAKATLAKLREREE